MNTSPLSLVGHVGFFSKEFNDQNHEKTRGHSSSSNSPAHRRKQALNQLCNKKELF
ncbi:hypothetical protein [Endozoicomonas numazuensis]|uniref:hypothetical protein n=1 Tax=Endozoicomonas numazuensis TaxID=1137799 RepID=UPI000A992506|nr:hypothetical protein [Endozoicomonas numazuensis]